MRSDTLLKRPRRGHHRDHVGGSPSPTVGEATGMALQVAAEPTADGHATDSPGRARDIAAHYGVDIGTELRVGHPARTTLGRARGFDTVALGSHRGCPSGCVGNATEPAAPVVAA
jgi:hypothetical protein